MATLSELRNKIQSFKDNLVNYTIEILMDNEALIVNMTVGNLTRGLRVDGSPTPTYTDANYGNLKRLLNPNNGGRFDMQYNKDSIDSMELFVKGSGDSSVISWRTDGWADYWNDNLAGSLFGIPDDRRNEVKRLINNEMSKLFQEKIGGKIGSK